MTRRQKFLARAGVLVAVALTMAFWVRPRGYTYQGRIVEQWFMRFANGQSYREYPATGEVDPVCSNAFQAMGTNSVPYLASRIAQDYTPSRLERWSELLPSQFQLTSKASAGEAAAILLRDCVKPPADMLLACLAPTFLSTNLSQKEATLTVLGQLDARFDPWLLAQCTNTQSRLPFKP